MPGRGHCVLGQLNLKTPFSREVALAHTINTYTNKPLSSERIYQESILANHDVHVKPSSAATTMCTLFRWFPSVFNFRGEAMIEMDRICYYIANVSGFCPEPVLAI